MQQVQQASQSVRLLQVPCQPPLHPPWMLAALLALNSRDTVLLRVVLFPGFVQRIEWQQNDVCCLPVTSGRWDVVLSLCCVGKWRQL